MISLEAILSSFALVGISEMGDKTQLLAFSMAARLKKPWLILGGIFVATVLNHFLASIAGEWISTHISQQKLAYTLALTFIIFGFWTLKPDTLEENHPTPKLGVFFTSAILFFLAEMGDKTQLATVALAAKYHSVLSVTIGTTSGMMLTDGLAVFLGDRLSHKVGSRWIRVTSASLFFIFGILSLWTAVRGKI